MKYILDESSGELIPFKQEVKYEYGVFIYGPNANINEIEGRCPLVYRTAKELSENLDMKDIKSWMLDKSTVVIRPVEIY